MIIDRSIWATSWLVAAVTDIICVFVPYPHPQFCFFPHWHLWERVSYFAQISLPSWLSLQDGSPSLKTFPLFISLILSYLLFKRLVCLFRFLGPISIIHKLVSGRCSMCSRSIDEFVWEKVASYSSNNLRHNHNPGKSILLTEILLLFSHKAMSDSASHWTAAHKASLSLNISQSLPEIMSIEWVKL